LKSKVEALGGNFLVGLKIDINQLDLVQNQLVVMISAFGDAVIADKLD
jgi:uncharacterized protein YbjQ (UPF0145 family)